MRKFYAGSIGSLLALAAFQIGTTNYYPEYSLDMFGTILLACLLVMFWFGVGGINIVNEWARRPVMHLGRYRGEIGPGFCWINPSTEWALRDVIIRDNVFAIEVKGVQTKDNVPLAFVVVLTTRINSVQKSVIEVSDIYNAVSERAKAAANGTIRAHDLSEILGEGLGFGVQILNTLKDKIAPWGIEAKAVEVKDFRILDENIERAISMKARAKKEAEAELVRAEMQMQISEQLNAAGEKLDEKGWQLKGLETLVELCRSANNNTILIPTALQGLLQTLGVKSL